MVSSVVIDRCNKYRINPLRLDNSDMSHKLQHMLEDADEYLKLNMFNSLLMINDIDVMNVVLYGLYDDNIMKSVSIITKFCSLQLELSMPLEPLLVEVQSVRLDELVPDSVVLYMCVQWLSQRLGLPHYLTCIVGSQDITRGYAYALYDHLIKYIFCKGTPWIDVVNSNHMLVHCGSINVILGVIRFNIEHIRLATELSCLYHTCTGMKLHKRAIQHIIGMYLEAHLLTHRYLNMNLGTMRNLMQYVCV